MPNALYPTGRTAICNQTLNLVTAATKIVAVSASYVFSVAHSMRDDLTGELGTATALTGEAWLNDGIFDADNVSYPDVDPPDVVAGFVLFVDTGDPATSPLVAYIVESTGGMPISVAGTGAPIPVMFSDSPNRVFRI